MNLPNRLTLLRLLLIPVFMIFTYVDNFYTRLLALVIFITAGITDLVDGHIARKRNMITPLGIFLDPLADKLVITAAFIAFVGLRELHIPAWMVVMIVGREFLITGLRTLAAAKGKIVGADVDGKFKTSVQIGAIITILTALTFTSALERRWGLTIADLEHAGGWRAMSAQLLDWTPYWMVFIATLFSLITGISYLRKHKALLREN